MMKRKVDYSYVLFSIISLLMFQNTGPDLKDHLTLFARQQGGKFCPLKCY